MSSWADDSSSSDDDDYRPAVKVQEPVSSAIRREKQTPMKPRPNNNNTNTNSTNDNSSQSQSTPQRQHQSKPRTQTTPYNNNTTSATLQDIPYYSLYFISQESNPGHIKGILRDFAALRDVQVTPCPPQSRPMRLREMNLQKTERVHLVSFDGFDAMSQLYSIYKEAMGDVNSKPNFIIVIVDDLLESRCIDHHRAVLGGGIQIRSNNQQTPMKKPHGILKKGDYNQSTHDTTQQSQSQTTYATLDSDQYLSKTDVAVVQLRSRDEILAERRQEELKGREKLAEKHATVLDSEFVQHFLDDNDHTSTSIRSNYKRGEKNDSNRNTTPRRQYNNKYNKNDNDDDTNTSTPQKGYHNRHHNKVHIKPSQSTIVCIPANGDVISTAPATPNKHYFQVSKDGKKIPKHTFSSSDDDIALQEAKRLQLIEETNQKLKNDKKDTETRGNTSYGRGRGRNQINNRRTSIDGNNQNNNNNQNNDDDKNQYNTKRNSYNGRRDSKDSSSMNKDGVSSGRDSNKSNRSSYQSNRKSEQETHTDNLIKGVEQLLIQEQTGKIQNDKNDTNQQQSKKSTTVLSQSRSSNAFAGLVDDDE